MDLRKNIIEEKGTVNQEKGPINLEKEKSKFDKLKDKKNLSPIQLNHKLTKSCLKLLIVSKKDSKFFY